MPKVLMLSQVNEQIIMPEPVIIPDPYASVAAIWDDIKAYCKTKMTPEQCDALLGYKPIYFPPTCVQKPKIPFWVYLGLGYIAGKHL